MDTITSRRLQNDQLTCLDANGKSLPLNIQKRLQGSARAAGDDRGKARFKGNFMETIIDSGEVHYAQEKTLYFVTTVCTVLLLIPYFLAAARTVALFSIMY